MFEPSKDRFNSAPSPHQLHLLLLTGRAQTPNCLRRGHLSISAARRGDRFGLKNTKHVQTYLPRRDNRLLTSAIISKAPKSAFYGDPCLSGQFRGALVISLQPARNAPQQRRTQCLDGADAVWASSAGSTEPHGLFDISGEGFTGEIDIGRVQ